LSNPAVEWRRRGGWSALSSEVVLKSKVLWFIGVVIAAVAAVAGFLYFTNKPTLHGAVIDPPMAAAEIHLQDFNGQPFTLSSLRGKVVILYFGYTNCTTECPLTMAHLKLALQGMGTKAADARVVMISTDPARDTPAAMKTFLGAFDPGFVGLVGTPEQLGQVWKDYGVSVEDGGETHSFFTYVIDPAGNFRETLLPDSSPADVSSDVLLLLKEQ
jgi:protein SCO1/2